MGEPVAEYRRADDLVDLARRTGDFHGVVNIVRKLADLPAEQRRGVLKFLQPLEGR